MYKVKQPLGGVPRKKVLFLQDRTITIEYTITCQRHFVSNLIIFRVVLKKGFEENNCSEFLDKTEKVIKEGFIS